MFTLPFSQRSQELRSYRMGWNKKHPLPLSPGNPFSHHSCIPSAFLVQDFLSPCWICSFFLSWTPLPMPLLWTFKCACILKALLFLNLIIKGRRREEEREKHVKWRRKSILHLTHLSKHLPNPAPPLPVSARHCGLILSASFQAGCVRNVLLSDAPDL